MRRIHSVSWLALAAAACANATPPTAPTAVPVAPGLPGPMGVGVTGRFVKTSYDVTGTGTLNVVNGIGELVLSADFSITQTPDPVLYINTTNDPNTGRPLRIASLKGKQGAQRFTFTVPAGVRYSWLIIWCDPFNVPMVEAAITPVP